MAQATADLGIYLALTMDSATPPFPPPLLPSQASLAELSSFSLADYSARVNSLREKVYDGVVMLPSRAIDQVAHNVFIAEREAVLPTGAHARSEDTETNALEQLRALGVTHILNAAYGEGYRHVPTTQGDYPGLAFLALALTDIDSQLISHEHLRDAAHFIATALRSGGKVVVHCVEGVSRSTMITLAALMLLERRPVEHLLRAVLRRREVYPNTGFLAQLLALEDALRGQGERGGGEREREKGKKRERRKEMAFVRLFFPFLSFYARSSPSTQKGKIDIIYTNKETEREYMRYINFLQHNKLLGNEVEHLELEDVQGVVGLKALRVNVLYDIDLARGTLTYEDLVKELHLQQ
jgi:predicted protein tyrosine phosphatase